MKGECPRCGSEELIFLFKQDRYSPTGGYVYTWKFLECCDCTLVFMEGVQSSTQTASKEEE